MICKILCLAAFSVQAISSQVIRNDLFKSIRNLEAKMAYTKSLAYGTPMHNGLGIIAPMTNGLPNVTPMTNGLPSVTPFTNRFLENGLAANIVSSMSKGGRFTVTSMSAIPTSGVRVQTEKLVVEGPLTVSGQLPFLGVVAMEGLLPASGQGNVQYNCGKGIVGITSEGVVTNRGAGFNSLAKAGPIVTRI